LKTKRGYKTKTTQILDSEKKKNEKYIWMGRNRDTERGEKNNNT